MLFVSREDAERFFRMAWGPMSDMGHCDAVDSAEYRRVLSEWIDARCPLPILPFIRRSANQSPEGSTNV